MAVRSLSTSDSTSDSGPQVVFNSPTTPYYASTSYQQHYTGARSYGTTGVGPRTPVAQVRRTRCERVPLRSHPGCLRPRS